MLMIMRTAALTLIEQCGPTSADAHKLACLFVSIVYHGHDHAVWVSRARTAPLKWDRCPTVNVLLCVSIDLPRVSKCSTNNLDCLCVLVFVHICRRSIVINLLLNCDQ